MVGRPKHHIGTWVFEEPLPACRERLRPHVGVERLRFVRRGTAVDRNPRTRVETIDQESAPIEVVEDSGIRILGRYEIGGGDGERSALDLVLPSPATRQQE